jgi:hypothetical protein
MTTRCITCTHWIWPWQHVGFRVGFGTWHTKCGRPVPRRDEIEPDFV